MPGVGFCNVIDQLLSVPVLVAELFVISSVYTPVPVPSGPVTDENPVSTPSGCCGLNRPKNGGPPLAIGVVAASSKTVFVKFWSFPVVPTPLKSGIVVPSGATSTAVRSGSMG